MWEDIDFAINYVNERYVRDPKTKAKRTRLYAYGVSLGGQVLLMYLGKVGKRASDALDGATVFSAIWEVRKSNKWFLASCNGFYNWLIGKSVSASIKSDQLPQIEKLMEKEDFKKLSNAIENCTGLNHLDEFVYVKMYGFKDK